MKEKFRDYVCLGEDLKVTKESLKNVCPLRDICKRHIYRQSKYITNCLIDNHYDHKKKECKVFIQQYIKL